MTKFKIHIPPGGRGTTIEIDGVPVTTAKSLVIQAGVDGALPTVSIEYIACDIEVEGFAHIVDVTGLSDKILRFELKI